MGEVLQPISKCDLTARRHRHCADDVVTVPSLGTRREADELHGLFLLSPPISHGGSRTPLDNNALSGSPNEPLSISARLLQDVCAPHREALAVQALPRPGRIAANRGSIPHHANTAREGCSCHRLRDGRFDPRATSLPRPNAPLAAGTAAPPYA